ncbi:MAG: hypothetical protein FJY29_09540 [Betaproteobacteria bacterium]|nr:hypothetical protein [Betaproteobacteria bacterium]
MVNKKAALLFFLSIAGCATYTEQVAKVRTTLSSGDTDQALALLEKSDVAKRKRDEVLFLMERGMLNYLSIRMSEAAQDWARALRRSEELYTLSLSKTLASVTVAENMTDYEGEDHEKVLLPIFSSMAFFSAGEPGKAQIEIRKAYEVINQLKLDQDESRSRIDGFPYLMSGMIYETNSNWDAAIIEYRKALSAYNKFNKDYGSDIRKMVADALWRIAEHRRRDDVLDFLRDLGFSKPQESLSGVNSQGEVFVVIEDGHSPIKVAQDYGLNLGKTIVNVSFPRYQPISNPSSRTAIYCDNAACGTAVKSTDIGTLAENALERRRLRDFAKMTARLILKEKAREQAEKHLGQVGSVALMVTNFVTERADTRSWTLLPANIQVARIKVPADKEVTIRLPSKSGLKPDQWTLKLPPGRKKMLRLRNF